MPDKIERVSNISYDATRVTPVRGYTDKERADIMESVEKQSQERMEALAEKRAYLAKYPTPKGAVFGEVLSQLLGNSKTKPSADDDEGYELSLSGQARQ
jgi:hypothetical protein